MPLKIIVSKIINKPKNLPLNKIEKTNFFLLIVILISKEILHIKKLEKIK